LAGTKTAQLRTLSRLKLVTAVMCRADGQTIIARGVYESAFKASVVVGRSNEESQGRQPDSGNPTVRDETRGLRKRELWWNYEPAAHTERVRVGNSLPVSCARRNSISTRSLQKPKTKRIKS